MKRILAPVLLPLLLCASFSFAADETDNLSFSQLMKQFSEEYTAGLEMPVPPAPEYREGEQQDDRYWVSVQASDKRARTKLLEAGMDIVEINKTSVNGVVPSALLGTLSQKGYKVVKKQHFREEGFSRGGRGLP